MASNILLQQTDEGYYTEASPRPETVSVSSTPSKNGDSLESPADQATGRLPTWLWAVLGVGALAVVSGKIGGSSDGK